MKVREIASALLFLCCVEYIDAALIEVDLFESGDRLLTRDGATGLEWLDLTATVGLSVDRSLNCALKGVEPIVDTALKSAVGPVPIVEAAG